MTEFTERYKQLADDELLQIVANASSYQEVAVDTAKQELLDRGVSEGEIDELIAQNLVETQEKNQRLQAQKFAKQSKIKSFFNKINPFVKGLASHEWQIRLLSWLFTIIALSLFIVIAVVFMENFRLIMILLQYPFEETFGYYFADVKIWCLVSVILFILSIIIGSVLFWKRIRIGWILTTIGILGSAIAFVMPLVQLLFFTTQQKANKIIDDFMMSDVTITLNIVYVTFFMFSLYVLFKRKVKNVFNVNRVSVYLTIVLAILLQFFIWYPFLRI